MQTKGSDETELDDEVPVLELSNESFYSDISSKKEELSDVWGDDDNNEFTTNLPRLFALPEQISEDEINVLN